MTVDRSTPDVLLLGPMRLDLGEISVGSWALKMRAVLAVLLLDANEAVSIEDIAIRVWGDKPAAAALIHVYIARIRAKLEASGLLIAKTSEGYRICIDPMRVDVHRFRQLVRLAGHRPQEARRLLDEALALWRGHPFRQFDSPWLSAYGNELSKEWRGATIKRNREWLDAGLHEALVDELRPLVARFPLDEQLLEQYLLALYRSGAYGEALRRYRRLVRRLRTEQGRPPSARLQALNTQMLRQDESLDFGAAPAAGVPVPSMLPPLTGPVIGRGAELGSLRTHLEAAAADRTPVAVLAVFGPPGVGKTTLAIRFAYLAKPRFPGGCLYADLGGFGPDNRPGPDTALDAFLIALGVAPARIPADLTAKQGLFRTLTARQRMLVVLDNAASIEDVTPLLPVGSGSVALITSRARLTALATRHRARTLTLGLLSPADSRTLLAHFTGEPSTQDDSEALDAIGDRCGGVPLALCLAGARLAMSPGEPWHDLAAELNERTTLLAALDRDADRASSLREVFSWSYAAVTPPAARLFRLLGVSPYAAFDTSAAAALAGTAPTEATTYLKELTRAHLVRRLDEHRYALHDLLGTYAADLSTGMDSDGERRQAVANLLDHQLTTAAAAMDVLVPGERHRRPAVSTRSTLSFADATAAREWLDTERHSLLGAARRAGDHGRPEHGVHLALVLWRYLDHGGHLAECRDLSEAAVGSAVELGDRHGEALARAQLGSVLIRLAEHRAAGVQLDLALEIFTALGDTHGIARTSADLGRVLWREGAYSAAVDRQLAARALFQQLGDAAAEARVLTNLGTLRESMGDIDGAAEFHGAALTLCESIDVPDALARAWGAAATVRLKRGDHDAAASLLDQALTAFRRLGDRVGEATTLTNQGLVAQARGRFREAVDRHEQALVLFHEIGNRTNETEVLNDLGYALRGCGRADHAIARHSAALDLALGAGDALEAARAHLGLATAHAAVGSIPDGGTDPVRHHALAAQSGYVALGLEVPAQLRALLAE